jgi:hypothetical protein
LQPLHKRGFERDLAVFHDVEVQTDAQYSSAGATIPRCHAGNRRNPPEACSSGQLNRISQPVPKTRKYRVDRTWLPKLG